METILQKHEFETEPCVVVIGNFDGVHKGHQYLINTAIEKGKTLGVKTAVLTFRPFPTYVVRGIEEEDIIFTPDEKINAMSSLGIDYYIEYPFDMDVATMEPELFIESIIVNQLKAKWVVMGSDFRFGKNRLGDSALMRSLSHQYNYEVTVCEKLNEGSRNISSTWVRETIKDGDMALYERLTGRHFVVTGIVEHGRAIGRTIGFPTANVNTPKYKILPPKGVYATYTYVKGKKYRSITNVGKKPGSVKNEIIVETYILDFEEMIYGEVIMIEMLHFLRSVQVLESLEELKVLISSDLRSLNEFFSSYDEAVDQ